MGGGLGSGAVSATGCVRLRVSVLTTGAMTFGGRGGFASVGSTEVDDMRRQVNLLDTPNVCSDGLSEEIFRLFTVQNIQ